MKYKQPQYPILLPFALLASLLYCVFMRIEGQHCYREGRISRWFPKFYDWAEYDLISFAEQTQEPGTYLAEEPLF